MEKSVTKTFQIDDTSLQENLASKRWIYRQNPWPYRIWGAPWWRRKGTDNPPAQLQNADDDNETPNIQRREGGQQRGGLTVTMAVSAKKWESRTVPIPPRRKERPYLSPQGGRSSKELKDRGKYRCIAFWRMSCYPFSCRRCRKGCFACVAATGTRWPCDREDALPCY